MSMCYAMWSTKSITGSLSTYSTMPPWREKNRNLRNAGSPRIDLPGKFGFTTKTKTEKPQH